MFSRQKNDTNDQNMRNKSNSVKLNTCNLNLILETTIKKSWKRWLERIYVGWQTTAEPGDKNSKGPTWRALKPNENHLKSTLCFGGRNWAKTGATGCLLCAPTVFWSICNRGKVKLDDPLQRKLQRCITERWCRCGINYKHHWSDC